MTAAETLIALLDLVRTAAREGTKRALAAPSSITTRPLPL
jgi:hypothetical protein